MGTHQIFGLNLLKSSQSSIMVAVEVAPSHTVSASHPPSKDKSSTTEHLKEGKRFLLLKDYPSAVESLASACEFVAGEHGETANECAEAYFHYGRALLEMGRMESGVLGNALDGVPDCEDEAGDNVENPEKMTEDEKEHVGVKVMEALEENFETHQEKINELVYGHTKNDYDDEDEIDEEDSQDDVMDDSEVPSGKPSEDEDPSNLERAWEMLELAKNIYSRMASTSQADSISRLCDTLLSLGEVSIENENYSQAVEDITSCLEKRKDKLPHEVRQMAEVQYQLGVALAYHAQFDEAVKYFNDAVKVLTELLAVVKADPIRASEVEELERIIPEIQEKIQDTIDSKEETSKAKKMKEDIGTSSDKPVNTIETKKK